MTPGLTKIEHWCTPLGLLAVPLFGEEATERRFVLLNGAHGNFCLDLARAPVSASPRDIAWSSDVGQYVRVVRDHVEVTWWNREDRPESIPKAAVAERLTAFQRYLEENQPSREMGIVPHVVARFRILRAVLGAGVTGTDALKAFLNLLACAIDGTRRAQVNLDHWTLDPIGRQVAGAVRPEDWDSLIEELTVERKSDQLRPVLPLVLRHAAGQLFQDAHYAALLPFSGQGYLAGILPPSPRVSSEAVGVGIHFTPPALARSIVEQAIRALPKRLPSRLVIYDPACGSAEFLREALRQLQIREYDGQVHLIGSDVSDAACAMSRFVLAWEKRHALIRTTFEIRKENVLAAEAAWPRNVNLVLMNPPFMSWQEMGYEAREDIKRILGELYVRRPDMASAFLVKASESLATEGVLGTVLPASILDGVSAERVRAELSTRLAHRLVGRLGSHSVFAGATVDAAIYVGVRGGTVAQPPTLLWADYRGSSFSGALRALRTYSRTPIEKDGFSVYPAPSVWPKQAGWAPRPLKAARLIERLYDYPTVGDLFDVRQGARTGLKSALVLVREEWKALPPRERRFFRPAVMNASLDNGRLLDSYYVFYPFGGNLPDIGSEEMLVNLLPCFFKQKLEMYKDALSARPIANESLWWIPYRHGTWQIAKEPKIVTAYFGGPGSFAWDPEGDFVVVQGYGWLPKGRLGETDFPQRFGPAYLAILNSPVVDTLLAGVSNNVGGGQWNLSKQFVSNMPLPDLLAPGIDKTVLDDLVRTGIDMCRGMDFDGRHNAEVVGSLYGIDSPRI